MFSNCATQGRRQPDSPSPHRPQPHTPPLVLNLLSPQPRSYQRVQFTFILMEHAFQQLKYFFKRNFLNILKSRKKCIINQSLILNNIKMLYYFFFSFSFLC